MQNSKEQQGKIRKPSSVISAKKQRSLFPQNGKDQRSLQKIKDTKGKFHAKMGLIKDRNAMDLREAEDIKRWQEYNNP